MASEDVLERVNNYAATLRAIDDRRREEGVAALDLIYALAAEVRELRAKLDSEASHRLSLCADNERFVAENAELRADLVWAVKHWSNVLPGPGFQDSRTFAYSDNAAKGLRRYVDIDGTPDSICRAVREARDGVS